MVKYSKQTLKRLIKVYFLSLTALLILFFAGFSTVYVNCYNSTHTDKISFCSFYEENGEVRAVILGNEFVIKK
jgi:hypothetical protein